MCVHTQLNLLMKRKNAATVAIHITANNEQHTEVQRQKSRMTRLNAASDSIISRTVVFKKRKNWDLHLESSRQDPKIRENPTLQHSGMILRMGEMARKPAWTLHKNCKWYDPRDRRSNIEFL